MDVLRRRLLERIDRTAPRVVRIVAPAGYGKSSFAKQFGNARGARVVDLRRAASARRTALDACREHEHDAATALVLDHAEDLDRAALDELAPFFKDEAGAPVLIASRLPVEIDGYVPPHRLLTLRSEDLRFTDDEIAGILGRIGVEPQHVAKVERLTRGWPILVFFVERLLREGALDLTSDMFREHDTMRQLFSFLQHQLYDNLDECQHDALVLAASVREFSVCDLALFEAASEFAQAFADLEDRSLLVHHAGLWDVSPLVRMLVRERDPYESRRLVRDLARAHAAAGSDLRAVELHLDNGDVEEAIALVERASEAGTVWTPAWLSLVTRIPFEALCARRRLWWIVQPHLFNLPLDHAYRAASAREGLFADDERALHAVLLTRAIFAVLDGKNDRAERMLATLVHAAERDPDLQFRACAYAYLYVAAARNGNVEAAAGAWETALAIDPAIEQRFAMERLLQGLRDAYVTDFSAQWRVLREAYDRVQATAPQRARIRCAKGLATLAWFADASEAVDYALTDLRALEHDDPATVTPLLELFAHGTVPAHSLQPIHRSLDLLVAATHACAREDREGAAPLLDLARDSLRGTTDPVLLRALAFAEHRLGSASEAPAILHVAHGTVSADGAIVTLPDRSIELLVFLRMHDRIVPRELLQDALWHDLPATSRRNALKSCVHRTRSLLGTLAGLLVSTSSGYAAQHLRIDLFDSLERCETLCETSAASTDAARSDAHTIAQAAALIQDGLPGHFHAHDAFAPLHDRLQRVAQRAWMRAGEAAIRGGDAVTLHQAVHALLALDEYDERAYALLISECLSRDDRDGAHREFGSYAGLLERELRATPSAELRALLDR